MDAGPRLRRSNVLEAHRGVTGEPAPAPAAKRIQQATGYVHDYHTWTDLFCNPVVVVMLLLMVACLVLIISRGFLISAVALPETEDLVAVLAFLFLVLPVGVMTLVRCCPRLVVEHGRRHLP